MNKYVQNKNIKTAAATDKSDPIRILLADDHALIRQALLDLLHGQENLMVVAQASTGREAVQKTIEYKPHVILMDVFMPEMNGIDATAEILNKLPDTRVIGLSMSNDSYTRGKMLSAGAKAYLDKTCLTNKLVEIILGVTK